MDRLGRPIHVPHSLERGNPNTSPNHINNDRQQQRILGMLDDQLGRFTPIAQALEAKPTDTEFPGLLVSTFLAQVKDLLEYDPAAGPKGTWFICDRKQHSWAMSRTETPYTNLIELITSNLQRDYMGVITHVHKVLSRHGLYEGIVKAELKRHAHTAKTCLTELGKKQTCKLLHKEIKAYFTMPGASESFNTNPTLLGCRDESGVLGIYDTQTDRTTTEPDRIKEARCTLELGVAPSVSAGPMSLMQHIVGGDENAFWALGAEIANPVLNGKLRNIRILQLCGPGSTSLVEALRQTLGSYCEVPTSLSALFDDGQRVVICSDATILRQLITGCKNTDILLMFNSGAADLATNPVLHGICPSHFAKFDITESPVLYPAMLWSWLKLSQQRDEPIPDTIKKRSKPQAQIDEALDQFLSDAGWCAREAPGTHKEVMKLSDLSTKFRAFCAEHNLKSVQFTLQELASTLKGKQYTVTRPQNTFKIVLHATPLAQ